MACHIDKSKYKKLNIQYQMPNCRIYVHISSKCMILRMNYEILMQ